VKKSLILGNMVCRHEKAPFRSLNRFMPGRYFSAYLSAALLNWRWLAGICRNMKILQETLRRINLSLQWEHGGLRIPPSFWVG